MESRMRGLMVFLCVAMIAGFAIATFAMAADLAVSVPQGPTQANAINPSTRSPSTCARQCE
jgi:hypothetical protein